VVQHLPSKRSCVQSPVPRKEKESIGKPGVVIHACNPSAQKAEAGGWQVQGQSGPHSATLSLRKKKKKVPTD
jgi:hypothetical protein